MATPSNIRRNVQNYRARLRAQGLRPKTVWVPDTRSAGFAERVRRDSLAVRDLPSERAALDWIEDAMDDEDPA
ncbi:MAG TPA: antitoxin MazE family protein [Azospirillum sp.]